MIEFTIHGVWVGRKQRRIPHSGNARLHWRERWGWNKSWNDQAGLWAASSRSKFLRNRGAWNLYSKVMVSITLHTIRPLDTDNAYACVKPIVDGLKGVLIVDDSPDHIELKVEQQKVSKRTDECVVVRVESL